MLKIGVTGGIGSGKSTVCRIFSQLGVPVYSADDRAKQLMTEDEDLVERIEGLFGPDAYLANGILNREHISDRAFHDATLLGKLNALVHPAVFRDFDTWLEQQTAPYIIKEAALLFESGSFRDLDFIVTVSAPRELRITRCMQRDGNTRKQVLARMDKQWTEKQRNDAADFIIKNDEKSALIPQVMELHAKFLFAASE